MKFLVNPWLGFLLLQATGLLVLQRRVTGSIRALVRVLLCSTLLVTSASTSLAHRMLEASLTQAPTTPGITAPLFIFVLGGGYVPGGNLDEDVLVAENQRRVLHGVTVWRRYPSAHLVFSGAAHEYENVRRADRMVMLMAETALKMGVTASALVLEPRSRNTREHPIEALRLPGVTPATPIGIVTSGVHMRRARHEFSRYFQHLQTFPLASPPRTLNWKDVIPEIGMLGANTVLLQEWLGMFWYAVVAAPSSLQMTQELGSKRYGTVGADGTA